jgi:anti-sigma B factor antagonist
MIENPRYTPGRDIVVSTVEGIKAEVKELVAASTGELLLDLHGVEMIDSKGLGLLIAVFNSLQATGRKLRITGAIPDLVDLFRVMRLDRHFVIA